MREEIQARLEALKKELETGQAELQKVEMQRTYLRETVLRIGGPCRCWKNCSCGNPRGSRMDPIIVKPHSNLPKNRLEGRRIDRSHGRLPIAVCSDIGPLLLA
jgi:hypothetical protein